MRKITYITGGERSGKSSFGQKMVELAADLRIYLATARILDDDFGNRVKRHKADRDESWTTLEEPIFISKLDLENKHVLLDCITLWLANIYYDNKQDVEMSLKIAKKEWDSFIDQNFELVVISNEMGMGVHGTNLETRKFVELQGWMNQYIASTADEAWFLVSGIPTKIK